jgi:transcriptional regulator with XRE-family HTH domain
MRLGKLLRLIRKKAGVTQAELAEKFNKQKPKGVFSINNNQLSQWERGFYTLSLEKLETIAIYGLDYSKRKFEEEYVQWMIENNKEKISTDKLHEILMKDSTPIVADEMIPAYSKLPIYKSLKDAYMEKGEIIGYFPKPPGLEDVPDNQLFWTPKPKGLILTNRVVNELEHGLRYVFKYDDDYSISRYSMPIDRQKIKPVGAIVGDFMFEQRLEN